MSYLNKDKQREAQRRHYKLNRGKYLEKRAERAKVNSSYVDGIKKRSNCVKCGFKDWRCLDYHHVSGKTDDISCMVKKGYAIETIKKEIEKCILVCANCHRIIHSEKMNKEM